MAYCRPAQGHAQRPLMRVKWTFPGRFSGPTVYQRGLSGSSTMLADVDPNWKEGKISKVTGAAIALSVIAIIVTRSDAALAETVRLACSNSDAKDAGFNEFGHVIDFGAQRVDGFPAEITERQIRWSPTSGGRSSNCSLDRVTLQVICTSDLGTTIWSCRKAGGI
jgi:hypothetical protein